MRSRQRKALLAGMAAIGVLVAVVSVTSASTVNITPAGDSALITSTNVTFTIGSSATITCQVMQGGGVITNPATPTLKFSPEPLYLQNTGRGQCSTTGLGGVKAGYSAFVHLKANSATSGSLFFEEEAIMTVGTCSFGMQGKEGFVEAAGTWVNGTTGTKIADPSTLTVSNAPFTLGSGHKECVAPLKEATTIGLSGVFVVTDTTHLNEPVLFK